jgi:hypothetical protein
MRIWTKAPGRRTKLIWLTIATLPLLSTGTCAEIAQTSLIDGYFDAVTPILTNGLQTLLDVVFDPSKLAELTTA